MIGDRLLFRIARRRSYRRVAARSREFRDREGRQWWIYHTRPRRTDTTTGVPIVFLHGFGGDGRTWLPFFPAFRDSRELVSVDVPGFGNSDLLIADDPTPTWYADRLSFLLQDFVVRWGQPPIVVGKSMGGMIAGMVAAKNPELVRALLLIAPAGIKPPEVSPFWKVYVEENRNVLLPRDRVEFDQMMRLLYERPVNVPGFLRRIALRDTRRRRPHLERVFGRLLSEGFDPLGAVLDEISTPTTVLIGDSDRIVDPSTREVLVERLPHGQVVIVDRCGHSPTREAPEAVASQLHMLLSRFG